MPSQTSMLHVRIDDALKTQATAALSSMGLSISDAVRLLLHRVVAEQGFPIELKVPNNTTLAAMKETQSILEAGSARFNTPEDLFDALEKNKRH